MYRIFVKNLEGFKKIFSDDERLEIARPLYLLGDINTFNSHKTNQTTEYCNLYEIIEKAKELRKTIKYHGFGMFLQELYLQCFDFKKPESCSYVEEELLDYQFDLLYQFMFPAYYS